MPAVTVNADMGNTGINVLGNDSDPDGGPADATAAL